MQSQIQAILEGLYIYKPPTSMKAESLRKDSSSSISNRSRIALITDFKWQDIPPKLRELRT